MTDRMYIREAAVFCHDEDGDLRLVIMAPPTELILARWDEWYNDGGIDVMAAVQLGVDAGLWEAPWLRR